MRMMVAMAVAGWIVAGEAQVERVFRPARVTRGNTNISRIQPIDEAAWVWLKGDVVEVKSMIGDSARPEAKDQPARIVRFRKSFQAVKGEKLTIDVSADERYYLTLDGKFVSRGPNRGDVANWQYQTYAIDLDEGEHVFEATVWAFEQGAPLAQLSLRPGFIFKASGAYDAALTTGKAVWQAAAIGNVKLQPSANGVFGTGSQHEMFGAGPTFVQPSEWGETEVIRGPIDATGFSRYGIRSDGWMLYPSQLPDQLERPLKTGEFVAAAKTEKCLERHIYQEAELKDPLVAKLNALWREGKPVTIPARTRLQAMCNLGNYLCAYPVVGLKGGRDAFMALAFTEFPRYGENDAKAPRNQVVGSYFDGYGDWYRPDGGEGTYMPPHFRCGKWIRLDVETRDEPLTITRMELLESRYPLESEGAFAAEGLADAAAIRDICIRTMQMCAHETTYDCPYYEQQMYPGDTRVELNVLSALSRDDRLIKRAIEIFALAVRDDGSIPFNYPTRGLQEGASYTLCHLLMYGDYVMNHADREWLRARVPAMRMAISGMEQYERADGLLADLPGWNFFDWVVGWDWDGTVESMHKGVNAELNLLYLLAMKSVAVTERALGNDLQAAYWEQKIEKLKRTLVDQFWCEERSLFADTAERRDFSEHSQCLALLGDVLPADQAAKCFERLIAEPGLKRCTVYFSYYLFECYFKYRRPDLFLGRLELWRDFIKAGLTTLQEQPDRPEAGEARSDCHAWGAHPIWFMQTGLAGIKSDAPFFERVRVAPEPGALKAIKAVHPHPQGLVKVELRFDGGKATGTVETPVPGVFGYGGKEQALVPGVNEIRIP